MVISRARVASLFRELADRHPEATRDDIIAMTATTLGQSHETVNAIVMAPSENPELT